MAYLYFRSFVVSLKGAAGRLEELSALMTVRKTYYQVTCRDARSCFRLEIVLVSLSYVQRFFLQVTWCGVALIWVYLGHCDGTLLCQLLFSLLAGVRVTEVRVEILVQDLCCLFVEVSSFPSAKRKSEVKNRNTTRLHQCVLLFDKVSFLIKPQGVA